VSLFGSIPPLVLWIAITTLQILKNLTELATMEFVNVRKLGGVCLAALLLAIPLVETMRIPSAGNVSMANASANQDGQVMAVRTLVVLMIVSETVTATLKLTTRVSVRTSEQEKIVPFSSFLLATTLILIMGPSLNRGELLV